MQCDYELTTHSEKFLRVRHVTLLCRMLYKATTCRCISCAGRAAQLPTFIKYCLWN